MRLGISLRRLLWLPLLWGLGPPMAWGASSALEQAVSPAQPTPPQWQHISKGVSLAPGEVHRLFLPAGAMLRVESTTRELAPDALTLYLDNGNGLSRQRSWRALPALGLVWDQPAQHHQLVLLERPAHRDGAVRFDLSISLPATPSPALYRQPIVLDLPRRTLVNQRTQERASFYHLNSGEAHSFAVEGPCHLRLQTRVLWDAQTRDLARYHRLRLQIDDQPPRAFEHYPGLDTGPRRIAEDDSLLFGSEEASYHAIPAGTHRLQLRVNLDTLIQTRALRCDSDLLLPARNGMRLGEADAAYLTLPRTRASSQAQQRAIMDRLAVQQEWIARAREVARDPARPEGALEAVQLLQRLAATSAQPQPLLAAMARIQNRWSRYRDLLPAAWSEGDLRYAYLPQRQLRKPGTVDMPPRLAPRLMRAALQGLPAATLVRVMGDRARHFPLQQRDAPTQLRLIVQRPPSNRSQRLELRFDDGTRHSLLLHPVESPNLEGLDYRTTLVESALASLSASAAVAGGTGDPHRTLHPLASGGTPAARRPGRVRSAAIGAQCLRPQPRSAHPSVGGPATTDQPG